MSFCKVYQYKEGDLLIHIVDSDESNMYDIRYQTMHNDFNVSITLGPCPIEMAKEVIDKADREACKTMFEELRKTINDPTALFKEEK